jgi:hypothetical protein
VYTLTKEPNNVSRMNSETTTPMVILPRRDTRILGISGRMATELSSLAHAGADSSHPELFNCNVPTVAQVPYSGTIYHRD